MKAKEFFQSQVFRGILIGILLAVAVLVVFQVGVFVGQRRSNFAHRFGDSFERNFRGPDGGERMLIMRDFMGEDIPGGHGAVGEVVSVSMPTFVVSGPDNMEKTVLVSDGTLFREYRDEVAKDSVAVGKHVVVLGSPNDAGQVEAKLVRFIPAPPEFDDKKTQ